MFASQIRCGEVRKYPFSTPHFHARVLCHRHDPQICARLSENYTPLLHLQENRERFNLSRALSGNRLRSWGQE